jgi:thiamine-phosphate pyrophosphorylase
MKANKPLIYLITEGAATVENFPVQKRRILEIIHFAVKVNTSLIQIREKLLTAKLVFELTREAAQITKNTNTKLLVNDRADIAFAADADGVHLTENSLSAGIIRRNFGNNFVIGVSAHTIETAESAKRETADFVTFSPVFDTPHKGKPQGLEKLREVCEKLKPFLIIALGGIDETNYRQVLENGASGFAAIRFLNDAENLQKLTDK